MNRYQKAAGDLMTALELAVPPIAVSLCDAAPPEVPAYQGVSPAGCYFWQEAAKRAFATSTKDHELCAIGVHTHHLAQPSAAQSADLRAALEAMSGLGYVRPEEVAAIPVVEHEVRHVVYGPLADFPIDPQVVLLFADARQGLIVTEAAARVDQGTPPAMGRPACAVIPQVLHHGCAAMSLGCCGARAYLDILPDSAAVWALPAAKLDQYCEQIGVLANANKTLTTFHSRRKEDIESGKRPSVQQSLERLV